MMKRSLQSLLFISFFATLLTGCSSSNRSGSVSNLQGKPAPDFELVAIDGGKVRLSELRGKPVLVAFFGYG